MRNCCSCGDVNLKSSVGFFFLLIVTAQANTAEEKRNRIPYPVCTPPGGQNVSLSVHNDSQGDSSLRLTKKSKSSGIAPTNKFSARTVGLCVTHSFGQGVPHTFVAALRRCRSRQKCITNRREQRSHTYLRAPSAQFVSRYGRNRILRIYFCRPRGTTIYFVGKLSPVLGRYSRRYFMPTKTGNR